MAAEYPVNMPISRIRSAFAISVISFKNWAKHKKRITQTLGLDFRLGIFDKQVMYFFNYCRMTLLGCREFIMFKENGNMVAPFS